MSANGRALRCAVTPAVISGSLFGTGTLAIPVGVVSVTVTGAGAPGGSDYVYNPGQPYVAEVQYWAGAHAQPNRFKWGHYSPLLTTSPTPIAPVARPTFIGQLLPYSTGVVTDCIYTSRGSWTIIQTNGGGYTTASCIGEFKGEQPYIPPTATGQPAKPAGWYWSYAGVIYEPFSGQDYDSMSPGFATPPTGPGQTLAGPVVLYSSSLGYSSLPSMVSLYFAGQPAIPAVAGQPYIAPWETGGLYTGDSTTATLNSVTKTWVGGYYTTPPASATYALTSTGAGQTLSYSVPAGGQLFYEYAF